MPPVPSSMTDLSTTASSNSPAGSDNLNTADDFFRAIQAIIKAETSTGAAITAASTITPDASGKYYVVSGSTTITAISSSNSWNGRLIVLKFSSTPVITHNASTLIMLGGASITAAAGDVAAFVQESSGVWRNVFYQKASGLPTAATGWAESGANSTITSMTGLGTPTVLANPVRVTDLQTQTVTAYTTAGTSTAYTLTTFATGVALTTNERWTVKFNATAGSSPTLNRDSKGAKSLMYYNASGTKTACTSSQIVANLISDVIYDGTDYVVLDPVISSNATSSSVSTSTGSSSIDFTSIPSGVKKIYVMFAGVSLSGTDDILIQIGDSGGVETSGYTSGAIQATTQATSTAGFILTSNLAATDSINGLVILTLLNSSTNLWSCCGSVMSAVTPRIYTNSGSKATSAVLDRVRVTVSGSNTIDANTGISIMYE